MNYVEQIPIACKVQAYMRANDKSILYMVYMHDEKLLLQYQKLTNSIGLHEVSLEVEY